MWTWPGGPACPRCAVVPFLACRIILFPHSTAGRSLPLDNYSYLFRPDLGIVRQEGLYSRQTHLSSRVLACATQGSAAECESRWACGECGGAESFAGQVSYGAVRSKILRITIVFLHYEKDTREHCLRSLSTNTL